MNCHTMKTKIVIFFALVSVFRLFADCESDKQQLLDWTYDINGPVSNLRDEALTVSRIAGSLSNGTLASSANRIAGAAQSISTYNNMIRGYAKTIDCSNQTCSVDLGPLCEVVSNIYDVIVSQYSMLSNCNSQLSLIFDTLEFTRVNTESINSILGNVTDINSGYLNVYDSRLLSAVSNFQNDVSFQCSQITNNLVDLSNKISTLNATVRLVYLEGVQTYLSNISDCITNMYLDSLTWVSEINSLTSSVLQYLPYLQTISDDLKSMYSLLSTNSAVSIDQAYTNMFRYSNLLGFDRFRYYAQGQLRNTQVSLYPLSPYDTLQNLRNATIYDAVAAGFESLLISQGSINNYLYWLQAVAGSNRLSVVDSHIMAISNMVYRLDDYVLNDFSNEIASISYKLSFVTNQVDYTTNLVEITNQLHTNNNHLASIDSKLDVLDYIKILSDTPLADYSGDIDYFDYLTNLYLSGVSSSGASTNWFERMEILLASLVFGDSDGTNDIPQSVEMQGFDTDRVSDTMSDFAFSEDFSTSVDNLSQTSRNFMQVLNGYSSALHAVSAPATVSIGTGGIDGSDTSSFEDMMHGHFQVSFNTGTSDRFTVVVRAVTTMSWVLLTMIFIWHCGFWILQKIQFLYRLMRLLINSIWLKS